MPAISKFARLSLLANVNVSLPVLGRAQIGQQSLFIISHGAPVTRRECGKALRIKRKQSGCSRLAFALSLLFADVTDEDTNK